MSTKRQDKILLPIAKSGFVHLLMFTLLLISFQSNSSEQPLEIQVKTAPVIKATAISSDEVKKLVKQKQQRIDAAARAERDRKRRIQKEKDRKKNAAAAKKRKKADAEKKRKADAEKKKIVANQTGQCILEVKLAAGGLVIDVREIGGSPAICRSAKAAVYKADPLPVSNKPDVFNKMRTLRLTLDPQEM